MKKRRGKVRIRMGERREKEERKKLQRREEKGRGERKKGKIVRSGEGEM